MNNRIGLILPGTGALKRIKQLLHSYADQNATALLPGRQTDQ